MTRIVALAVLLASLSGFFGDFACDKPVSRVERWDNSVQIRKEERTSDWNWTSKTRALDGWTLMYSYGYREEIGYKGGW